MAKARKRRKPGAGRPPAGPITGKKAIFSTRITEATRSALDAEARASGQSVSQVAERLIQMGLAQIQERQTSAPTRALAYLISRLADGCSIKPGNKQYLWHQDSFAFEALEQATAMLFKTLRPKTSEIQTDLSEGAIPAIWKGILSSPETLATTRFLALCEQLNSIERISASDAEQFTSSKNAALAWSRHSYVISDAKRDLQLSEIFVMPSEKRGD
jgi:hypothetical protein